MAIQVSMKMAIEASLFWKGLCLRSPFKVLPFPNVYMLDKHRSVAHSSQSQNSSYKYRVLLVTSLTSHMEVKWFYHSFLKITRFEQLILVCKTAQKENIEKWSIIKKLKNPKCSVCEAKILLFQLSVGGGCFSQDENILNLNFSWKNTEHSLANSLNIQ